MNCASDNVNRSRPNAAQALFDGRTDVDKARSADKSLPTFVAEKAALLLAAATDLRGRGSTNAIPRLIRSGP